ncbi:MAG: hypothetical protein ACRD1Z_12490, partial [Vicinamibacteria bacterium]
LHDELERVLRDYERLSRGRLGSFTKELELIAKQVRDLREAKRLSPRHAKLLEAALQHTRRIHFWNARRSLAKIGRVLEPVREWRRGLEEYRAFQRKTGVRVREAEATLARLLAIPKPPLGPEDVAAVRSLLEMCDRAVDEAWGAQTHRPVVEAIKDLQSHPDVDGLGLLATKEFASLRELGDLLEADPALKEMIGARPLSELVLTSEYSVAKWDRVYPQAAHARRKLQDLLHHLRPVVTGTHGSPFNLGDDVHLLQRRVAAWRAFPGTVGAQSWTEVAALLRSGKLPMIQESARAYERHGDLAVRAWDGSLAKEISEHEAELKAAKKDLAALPDSATLAK